RLCFLIEQLYHPLKSIIFSIEQAAASIAAVFYWLRSNNTDVTHALTVFLIITLKGSTL
ncbi:MAG: hypothetical protein ACJAV0_001696, partial [Shewanella sp.]